MENTQAAPTALAILVDGKPIDYSGLPEHLQGGMRRYLEDGRPVGSFLRAVLSNDLCLAVLLCSDVSQLPSIARWLVNDAPQGSFGSREAYFKRLGSSAPDLAAKR